MSGLAWNFKTVGIIYSELLILCSYFIFGGQELVKQYYLFVMCRSEFLLH